VKLEVCTYCLLYLIDAVSQKDTAHVTRVVFSSTDFNTLCRSIKQAS